MSDTKAALISAFSGLLGVVAGAGVTAYTTLELANLQLAQSKLATAAESALSIRTTLAEKASAFFLANQNFLDEFRAEKIDLEKLRVASKEISDARSGLTPYLDADLLIACDQMADSVHTMLRGATADSEDALKQYQDSYKEFMKLYLRLRRDLEKQAQLDLLKSQVRDS